MREGARNGAFGGKGSFMTNYYSIWYTGLDGEAPNWYGVRQGNTYASRMFDIKSMDVRASFYKFYTYLLQIASKEAQKERAMVEQYLNKAKTQGLDQQQINAIQRAIDDDNFGMAYTLLLKTKEEYSELVREFKGGKFRNISHTNSFWNKQFANFLKRKLDEEAIISDEKLIQKIGSNTNMTIDSLVEEWASELLFNSDGVIISSIEEIKSQMKGDLLKHLQDSNITGVNSIYDSVFGSDNNITSLTKKKTIRSNNGKGRRRTLSGLTREITDLIANAVGKGMSQEIATVAEQGKAGASLSTGKMMKHIVNEFSGYEQDVYQKGDVMSFLLFEGSFDIQKVAKEIFKDSMEPTKEQIELFEKKIKELAKSSDEIFQISTNVKGYRSRFDLTIAKNASYSQRVSDLIHMAEQADGLPSFSMEKLAFMFNNTMRGCLCDNRIQDIAEYVAAICAAWLWDDYGEIFSINEDNGPIKKIRMFSSGGIYYSSSQLIKRAAEQLIKKNSDSKNFVNVTFSPPSFNADSFYAELKGKNPLPSYDSSYEEWQGVLQNRWTAMRNQVMEKGRIHIAIIQKELEAILGELSFYL